MSKRPTINHERVIYVGNRMGVRKIWRQREWVFKRDEAVQVPDDFAAALLKSPSFIREDEADLRLDQRVSKGMVAVRRWGAIGDLIMFRAAVSAFRRHSRGQIGFVLRCQTRFAHLFESDPVFSAVRDMAQPLDIKVDETVSFDQVAERDHRGDERHRVDLFLSMMTKDTVSITRDDWMLPMPPAAAAWVDRFLQTRKLLPEQRTRTLICVQVRGSTPAKRLPKAQMQRLIQDLSQDHEVVLIEYDRNTAHEHMTGEHVYEMSGRDVAHTIHLLRRADAAVVFDSGVLWMAHAAPVRTLALLGPTRPAQRITYHPFYPDAARAISLNDIINCPACFEQAKACGGKHWCMQEQPDWDVVHRMIAREIESLLGTDVALPQMGFMGGKA